MRHGPTPWVSLKWAQHLPVPMSTHSTLVAQRMGSLCPSSPPPTLRASGCTGLQEGTWGKAAPNRQPGPTLLSSENLKAVPWPGCSLRAAKCNNLCRILFGDAETEKNPLTGYPELMLKRAGVQAEQMNVEFRGERAALLVQASQHMPRLPQHPAVWKCLPPSD